MADAGKNGLDRTIGWQHHSRDLVMREFPYCVVAFVQTSLNRREQTNRKARAVVRRTGPKGLRRVAYSRGHVNQAQARVVRHLVGLACACFYYEATASISESISLIPYLAR